MTVIQVRTAEQQQAVRMIRERVFVEEQGVPRHLEYDTHDETAIHLLVLDEQSRPVATGRTRPYDDQRMKVERVASQKAFCRIARNPEINDCRILHQDAPIGKIRHRVT